VRVILDEQLSPQIAALLRKAGYDADAVAEREDLIGRSDRAILEVAWREGRAVVTNNIKDFRPLAAEWLAQGRVHAGLILLPSTRTRSRNAIAAVAAAIETVLRDHPDGLSGSERWIGPLPQLYGPRARHTSPASAERHSALSQFLSHTASSGAVH
jgi:predicted nuclease of predicted toxin-antitoxin system